MHTPFLYPAPFSRLYAIYSAEGGIYKSMNTYGFFKTLTLSIDKTS